MLKHKYDATIDIELSINRIIVTVIDYDAIGELLVTTIGKNRGIDVRNHEKYRTEGQIYIWYNCNYEALDVLNELHEILNTHHFTKLRYKLSGSYTGTVTTPNELFDIE